MSPAAFHDCHGVSYWTPEGRELPDNLRCVLATDGEAHFIAVCDTITVKGKEVREWVNAHDSEPIDSVITHWMELPEIPEV